MGVISAKLGKISTDGTNAQSTVRNVRIAYTSRNALGKASGANQGMQFGVGGVTDFTGSFEFYGKAVPIFPGSSAAGDTTLVVFTGSERITGTIIVESTSIRCDIEGGGMLSGVCNFAANGALTFSSSTTALTDTNTPNAFAGKLGKARFGTPASPPVYADIAGVRSWDLDLRCELKPYNMAENAGVTKRVAGPLSASASVSMYEGTPSVLVT